VLDAAGEEESGIVPEGLESRLETRRNLFRHEPV